MPFSRAAAGQTLAPPALPQPLPPRRRRSKPSGRRQQLGLSFLLGVFGLQREMQRLGGDAELRRPCWCCGGNAVVTGHVAATWICRSVTGLVRWRYSIGAFRVVARRPAARWRRCGLCSWRAGMTWRGGCGGSGPWWSMAAGDAQARGRDLIGVGTCLRRYAPSYVACRCRRSETGFPPIPNHA